jgi:phosphatidylglycerophosphatase A
MLKKQEIVEFVSTIGYLGKYGNCPGTFGSLAAFPFSYIVASLTLEYHVFFEYSGFSYKENEVLGIIINMLCLFCFIFLLGCYCVDSYQTYTIKHDPKEVIIDEVAGQILTSAMVLPGLFWVQYSKISEYISSGVINILFLFVLPFGLFRLFDILKPWPIDLADKSIKNGFGVMFDDVLAALFASVSHYAIIFIAINFFQDLKV